MSKLTKMQLNRIEGELKTILEEKMTAFALNHPVPDFPNTTEIARKTMTVEQFFTAYDEFVEKQRYGNPCVETVLSDLPQVTKEREAYNVVIKERDTALLGARKELYRKLSDTMTMLYLKGADDAMEAITAFRDLAI